MSTQAPERNAATPATLHQAALSDKLTTKSAIIGIVGLGYVGLPLAVAFAEVGFTVIGLDLNAEKVRLLNTGESYIPDIPTAQVAPLVAAGKLRASTSYDDLRTADAVSVCVPTPLTKTKDPDMSFVISASDALTQIAHPGLLIVLESTTYPGTTDEVLIPRLRAKGLLVGHDVFVAFSPERIDPANKTWHVRNTPKVIGGATEACQAVTCLYYGAIVDTVVPVSSPAAAEMVKLLENTFRAVNIGLVNEVALMCDKLGVDVWEVIKAAASKPFGFMPFYPGPGLGGHCIPIDPLYLSWKLKTLNYNSRFIELASAINTSMPLYVLDKITAALNDDAKAVRGSTVAVLGVAYKRDVDDVRESPALDIIQLLQDKGATVSYHDPHIAAIRLEHGRALGSTALTADWLRTADCVVIVTDHTSIDYGWVIANSEVIVDTRNATGSYRKNGQAASGARIVKL
jgi:UDP-N-acetyl-D-glucosamine dehydrogenase